MDWNVLPKDEVINKTAKALSENGIKTIIVENGQLAKEKALELLPKNAQVMTATSTTTDQIGLAKAIDESDNYDSIRKKIMALSESEQRLQMRRMSASADYVVGSVQAVTQDGHVLVASNSGSQLPLYAFSAANVIWVVGAQKIVTNTDQGIKRIYEHSFKLEDKRARKVYGMGSAVNKILIIKKEIMPDRITMILVKEVLGF